MSSKHKKQLEEELEKFCTRFGPLVPAEAMPYVRGAFVAGATSGAKFMAIQIIQQTEPVLEGFNIVGAEMAGVRCE